MAAVRKATAMATATYPTYPLLIPAEQAGVQPHIRLPTAFVLQGTEEPFVEKSAEVLCVPLPF